MDIVCAEIVIIKMTYTHSHVIFQYGSKNTRKHTSYFLSVKNVIGMYGTIENGIWTRAIFVKVTKFFSFLLMCGHKCEYIFVIVSKKYPIYTFLKC